MNVSDDFRVIAWTLRAGNHLGLLLLLTLLSISVQSDITLPRERRFSWRTGTNKNKEVAFFVCPNQFNLLNILLVITVGFLSHSCVSFTNGDLFEPLYTSTQTQHTLLVGSPRHSFSLLIIAERHCTTAFLRFPTAGNKVSSSLLTHIVVSVLTPVQLAQ